MPNTVVADTFIENGVTFGSMRALNPRVTVPALSLTVTAAWTAEETVAHVSPLSATTSVAEAAVGLISVPDGTLVTVTVIDPLSSPTSSSTVAISSATVGSPAPNVTDVGFAPLMKSPSCVTETLTISAAAAEPVRLSVNAAASPSRTPPCPPRWKPSADPAASRG